MLLAMDVAAVVTFNVGGSTFTAAQDTLQACPALARMVLGDHATTGVTRDASGLPFVDGDPVLFQHLLFFLRQGKLPAAAGSSPHLLQVRAFMPVRVGCSHSGALKHAGPALGTSRTCGVRLTTCRWKAWWH
jgi:hypothetical protein